MEDVEVSPIVVIHLHPLSVISVVVLLSNQMLEGVVSVEQLPLAVMQEQGWFEVVGWHKEEQI